MVTLTKAEERIMKILWEIGEGFIKDIIEQFPDPKPPYNSVSTIVRVLVQKEIVGFTAYGNTHKYHPLISRDEYSKGQLSRLLKDYYNNSLREVVSFFSESKKLDEKELDEVMKMLEELKAKRDA
ncbi:MAG TPA: BlaI/MecI/CopY family transcriptional regulator [Chryseolinea sp.]|jgi:predicted transcriptional regulator|nr:BlaI/MecI/CopY family transcriptional regulator [Chryseolinea sp.]